MKYLTGKGASLLTSSFGWIQLSAAKMFYTTSSAMHHSVSEDRLLIRTVSRCQVRPCFKLLQQLVIVLLLAFHINFTKHKPGICLLRCARPRVDVVGFVSMNLTNVV